MEHAVHDMLFLHTNSLFIFEDQEHVLHLAMDIHRLQTAVFVQGDVQEQFARMQPLGSHVGVDV